jgi:polyhydroxybutyrate depolymerase
MSDSTGYRRSRFVLLLAGGIAVGWGSVAVLDHRSATAVAGEEPAVAGQMRRSSIQLGSLERTFLVYTPPDVAERPGLVLAFHGSGGDGARMRGFVGESLEPLADEHGFLVIYPDGYERNWNDCRARAPFPANRLDIDDVGFVRALIERVRRDHQIDRAMVHALGYSNGGHMAYRLALEIPGEVQAVAAFGANLPVAEELDCNDSGRPVPVLVVNGTADGINPYMGGEVIPPGGESFGRVRPAEESVRYFARLVDWDGSPEPEEIASDSAGLRVERLVWERSGRPGVVLYTVHGGGHAIPGPAQFPPFVGPVERRLNAVEEAVRFFRAQALVDANADSTRTTR